MAVRGGARAQAFKECESEWSTHNAKACIDTTQKGLKGSVPENFHYVNVEFGISGGYVHVIDVRALARVVLWAARGVGAYLRTCVGQQQQLLGMERVVPHGLFRPTVVRIGLDTKQPQGSPVKGALSGSIFSVGSHWMDVSALPPGICHTLRVLLSETTRIFPGFHRKIR